MKIELTYNGIQPVRTLEDYSLRAVSSFDDVLRLVGDGLKVGEVLFTARPSAAVPNLVLEKPGEKVVISHQYGLDIMVYWGKSVDLVYGINPYGGEALELVKVDCHSDAAAARPLQQLMQTLESILSVFLSPLAVQQEVN